MVYCAFIASLAHCSSSPAAEVDVSKLPPPAAKTIDFVQDIKPILENSCIRCHGPEKPKSKFRLDNKTAALKGGESGTDIIPGDSAKSPLIHYVARLVEDMEMPPAGKGEPLTKEQIALLRAWIDQGVQWPEADTERNQPVYSISPGLRWVGVSGDQQKFRELYWMKDGWNPGVEQFSLRQPVGEEAVFSMDGHAFPVDEDFRVSVRYDRTDVGFVHGGFEQYRKYYDNSGGFYPFAQPIFTLDRELHMDLGRAWIDFGLTLPNWPKLVLGYEYQFRQGTKSTLQWGMVQDSDLPLIPTTNLPRKNIYPAFKDVDEKVHILKFDASHEIGGIGIEDNFRAEFYDLKTRRVNALSVTQGQQRPTQSVVVDEAHDQSRAVNTLRLEKEIRDWWYVSGGYLYSAADADAAFRQITVHATGFPISGDFWNSQSIILSQNSHLFNVNMRLGPWEGLTLSGGVQSEWTHQEGVGRVSFDEGNPVVFLLIQPATLDANLDKNILQENVALRFTRIPFTSLFAEARLEQEKVNQYEDQIGGANEFLRDTDASAHSRDLRAGFYTSPLRQLSLGGHYRSRYKKNNYDHLLDQDPAGGPNVGYPAFIRRRVMDTDEVEAKLTIRPWNWLKTTLTYKLVDTDFDSDTDAAGPNVPGGPLRAGNFNANVYGINFILTPFSRWYFSGTFDYYDSRTITSHNNVPSVVPHRGDIYTFLGSATYALNENTDLSASYAFSRANYAQDNFLEGLPVGIDYDRHDFRAGVTRRFKRGVAVNLQYGFFKYSEPTSGGFNDLTAHAVFATLTLNWH